MSTLTPLFNYLGDKVPIGTVFVVCLLIYLVMEMRYIRRDLSNHITDTNQKIDRLSDRFDKLYHHLLKEKDKK